MNKREALTSLMQERDTQMDVMDDLVQKLQDENRDATKAEHVRVQAAAAKIGKLDRQIRDLDREIANNAAAGAVAVKLGAAVGGWGPVSGRVGREPLTYERSGEHSWITDVVMRQVRGDHAASERLARHSREIDVELRSISTTAGAGGEFSPPMWAIEDWVGLPRAGRVVASIVKNAPLPPGTDQINLPKITGGTTVAAQSTQNSGLSNTDITTSSVQGAVLTHGGIQVTSLQLLEQSPAQVDEILLGDLMADYDRQIDSELINGSGSSGQFAGILGVSSINAVTYTDASPALTGTSKLWNSLAQALSLIAKNRYAPATAFVMHPSRWSWILAALDTATRPLVVPEAQGPFNAVASVEGGAQGRVGTLFGLPVFVTANVPTNLGAGTNQDAIIALKADDLYFYEGTPRLETFRETKADQGSVLLRLYNYGAFIPNRLPKSIAAINGTGLITPSGF